MVCDNVNVMKFINHEFIIQWDFSLEVSFNLINLVLNGSKDSVRQFLIFHLKSESIFVITVEAKFHRS